MNPLLSRFSFLGALFLLAHLSVTNARPEPERHYEISDIKGVNWVMSIFDVSPRNGKISSAELVASLQKVVRNPDDAPKLATVVMPIFDVNGDGEISDEELVNKARELLNFRHKAMPYLVKIFFDQDVDGFISGNDYATSFKKLFGKELPAEKQREMKKQADEDNDGKITLQEFANWRWTTAS